MSAARRPLALPVAALDDLVAGAGGFAAATASGARPRTDRDGRPRFDLPAVEASHQELRAALGRALAPERARLEREGVALERLVDRVVLGWVRAAPGPLDFVSADLRRLPGFAVEVLRAELHELGIDLRPVGGGTAFAVPGGRAGARALLLPALGGMVVGATSGLVVELALGASGAALVGMGAGALPGTLAAVRLLLAAPADHCSRCASALEPAAPRCPRCGALLARDEPGDGAQGEEEAGNDEGPVVREDERGQGQVPKG